jgi:predicted ATPase/class 3 adenylate cyclase
MVSLLFTDIEGSTPLWEQMPQEMQAAVAQHHAILYERIAANGGGVFQVLGDAFQAGFRLASDALMAAVDCLRALRSADWGPTGALRVRMGIHTGQVELDLRPGPNGEPIYAVGHTLNRAARVMSAGFGGQVLLSQEAANLVERRLPDGVSLKDLGLHRLKGMQQPEHLFQAHAVDLPADFPPLATALTCPNNLPAQLTPFVGREREIAALLGLLRNPAVHLVTLTGPGGSGKTRLSMQVAAGLLEEYEHGVWFVELAAITSPDLFLPTLAAALKVNESAGRSVEQVLIDFLRDRHLLLVLDNFEQIVSAAPAIGRLLVGAPRVKVLVSSREVLRLRGEHDFPVPPLGLPEYPRKQTAEVLAQYEAVALFLQHAQAANPFFSLDDENAPIVAEICARLDGLPLALELASARTRLLKPANLLEKLKKSFDLLAGGARDLPARQQTIRGTIDWSYDLLDKAEQALFARLGVFSGGWTLESAEAVGGADLPLDVLTRLESLLDKSLIRQYDSPSGEPRYTMLEVVHAYAVEKLSQSTEQVQIRQAHAEEMDRFLQEVYKNQHTPEEGLWFNRMDDELDNLRSAVEWAFSNRCPAFIFRTVRLWEYWDQRTNYREPLGWMERARPLAGDDAGIEYRQALTSAGNMNSALGFLAPARRDYETALAIAREENDTYTISVCLGNLGIIAWKEKDFATAQQLFEQVLTYHNASETWAYGLTLFHLGSLAEIRGDEQTASRYYNQALEIYTRTGVEAGISYANMYLGILAMRQCRLEDAMEHFINNMKATFIKSNPLAARLFRSYQGYVHVLMGHREEGKRLLDDAVLASLEYLERSGAVPGNGGYLWLLFEGQARLALSAGQAERAARLFGAGWNQRERDDLILLIAEKVEYEARVAETRAALGEEAYEAAFQQGHALSLKAALVLAAEEVSPRMG